MENKKENNLSIQEEKLDSLKKFLENIVLKIKCLRAGSQHVKAHHQKEIQKSRQEMFLDFQEKIYSLQNDLPLLLTIYENYLEKKPTSELQDNFQSLLAMDIDDNTSTQIFLDALEKLTNQLFLAKAFSPSQELYRHLVSLAQRYHDRHWPYYWMKVTEVLYHHKKDDEDYYPIIANNMMQAWEAAKQLRRKNSLEISDLIFLKKEINQQLDLLVAEAIYRRLFHPDQEWATEFVEQCLENTLEESIIFLKQVLWSARVFRLSQQKEPAKKLYLWLLDVANRDLPQIRNFSHRKKRTEAEFSFFSERLKALANYFKDYFEECRDFLLDSQSTKENMLVERLKSEDVLSFHDFDWWTARKNLKVWREKLDKILQNGGWEIERKNLQRERSTLFQELLKKSEAFLGKPPCHYALIATGSTGREEACAYSDIEFTLILGKYDFEKKSSVIVKDYFDLLLLLFSLQVITFRETPSPNSQLFSNQDDNLLSPGLGFDKYTPLRYKELRRPLYGGKETILEVFTSGKNPSLLKNIDEALNEVSPTLFSDPILPLILLDSFLLYGDGQLHADYLNETQKLLEKEIISQFSLRQLLGLYLLNGLQGNSDTLKKDIDASQIDMKNLFSTITTLIKGLSLYHGIDLAVTNSLERLDILRKKGFVASSVALAWKEWLLQAEVWRNKVHLQVKAEQEIVHLNQEFVISISRHHVDSLYFHIIQPTMKACQDFIKKAKQNEINESHSPFAQSTCLMGAKFYFSLQEKVRLKIFSLAPLLDYLYIYADESGHRLSHVEAKHQWEATWREVCVEQEISLMEAHSKAYTNRILVSWVDEKGKLHHGFLNPKVVDQLLDEEGSFNQKKREAEGRRIALPIRNAKGEIIAYAKAYPELPLVQIAVDELAWRLSGYGNLATLCKFTVLSKNITYPVLLSRYTGSTLQKKLREKGLSSLKELEESLDLYSFTLKVMESYLVASGDDKFDNMAEETFITAEDEKQKRLISIDADHAFEPMMIGQGKGEKIGLRTVVYCFNLMDKPLHPRAVEEIKRFNPHRVLEAWLTTINKLSQHIENHGLFDKEKEIVKWTEDKTTLLEWAKNKMSSKQEAQSSSSFSFIPLVLEPGTVAGIYQRFRRLQRALTEERISNAWELIHYLMPHLAKHYHESYQQFPDRIDQRFHTLPMSYEQKVEKTKEGEIKQSQTTLSSKPKIERSFISVEIKHSLTWMGKKNGIAEAILHNQIIGASIALRQELPQIYQFYEEIEGRLKRLRAGDITAITQWENTIFARDFLIEEIVNRIQWNFFYERRSLGIHPHFKELLGSDDQLKGGAYQLSIITAITGISFQRLCLKDCKKLTNRQLKAILKNSHELMELDISGCSFITDDILFGFSNCSTYLQLLDISRTSMRSLENMGKLGKKNEPLHFPQLKKLVAEKCKKLTVIHLKAPQLQIVRIENFEQLTLIKFGSNLLGDIESMNECIQIFEKYAGKHIEISSLTSEDCKKLGYKTYVLGDYKAAIISFNMAIIINPKDALAYNNRGAAKDALGEFELAKKDYNQAIYLQPDFLISLWNLMLAGNNLIRVHDNNEELYPQKVVRYRMWKDDDNDARKINILLFGNTFAGKTALSRRYCYNETPGFDKRENIPVLKRWTSLHNKNYRLRLIEIGSQIYRFRKDSYITSGIRSLEIPNTVVIFLLDVTSTRESLVKIYDDLVESHIKFHSVKRFIPKLLIGTQIDLGRNIPPAFCFKMGVDLAKEIGACEYLECSAMTGEGVEEVFQKAIIYYEKYYPPYACFTEGLYFEKEKNSRKKSSTVYQNEKHSILDKKQKLLITSSRSAPKKLSSLKELCFRFFWQKEKRENLLDIPHDKSSAKFGSLGKIQEEYTTYLTNLNST